MLEGAASGFRPASSLKEAKETVSEDVDKSTADPSTQPKHLEKRRADEDIEGPEDTKKKRRKGKDPAKLKLDSKPPTKRVKRTKSDILDETNDDQALQKQVSNPLGVMKGKKVDDPRELPDEQVLHGQEAAAADAAIQLESQFSLSGAKSRTETSVKPGCEKYFPDPEKMLPPMYCQETDSSLVTREHLDGKKNSHRSSIEQNKIEDAHHGIIQALASPVTPGPSRCEQGCSGRNPKGPDGNSKITGKIVKPSAFKNRPKFKLPSGSTFLEENTDKSLDGMSPPLCDLPVADEPSRFEDKPKDSETLHSSPSFYQREMRIPCDKVMEQLSTSRGPEDKPGDTKDSEASKSSVHLHDFKARFSYAQASPPKLYGLKHSDSHSAKLSDLGNVEIGQVQDVKTLSPKKKSKQLSKSTRTITALAVAPFQQNEDGNENKQRDYRFLLGAEEEVPSKRKKRSKKASIAQEQRKPKLLDPETAKKKIDRQDFLFASSSQLVSGDSPSFIRDVQKALKQSEPAENTVEFDYDLRPIEKPKSLWSVGIRGDDGFLLEPESPRPVDRRQKDGFADIDALHSDRSPAPKLSSLVRTNKKPQLLCLSPEKRSMAASSRPVLQPLPTNAVVSTAKPAPFKKSIHTKAMRKETADEKEQIAGDVERLSPDPHPISPKRGRGRPRKGEELKSGSSKSTEKVRNESSNAHDDSIIAPEARESSGWDVIDDIQDSEPEPASSPRRSKKKRKKGDERNDLRPLELSPFRVAQQAELSTAHTVKASISSDVASKRNKGKKTSISGKLSKHKILKLFQKAVLDSISPSLFPLMTRCVKSTPQNSDPKAPSWNEKILLYDPIVLEDLTAWLNHITLRSAGWKGVEWETVEDLRKKAIVDEARAKGLSLATSLEGPSDDDDEGHATSDPFENIPAEYRGIGGGQGKTKRKGAWGGEGDLAFENIEAWIVQAWCEHNSICCLWKEGLRGGVKQNY